MIEKFYEARRWWHNRRYYFHEFRRSEEWIQIQGSIEMVLLILGCFSLPWVAYLIGLALGWK